ncbi:MAG: DUF6242 domain-containing protein [Candidatus Aphodosoma sp.]
MNRITFSLLLATLVIITFVSCIGNNNDTNNKISETAVITGFSLKGNSAVSKCRFSINQDSMLIYNADSLDMHTRIDSLYAVINPTFHKIYVNDTIDFYMFDTLWLNFENQFTFRVVAADKKTEATYRLNVNKHTVDPDTIIWEGIATQVFRGVTSGQHAVYLNEKMVYMGILDGTFTVYTSVNGKTWNAGTVSGLPDSQASADLPHSVSTGNEVYLTIDNKLYKSPDGLRWTPVETEGGIDRLLFYMNNALYAVAVNGKEQTLMRLDDNYRWTEACILPYDFPVTGEAILVSRGPSGAYRAFVAGGIDTDGNYLNSVWSTEDCSYWSNLSSGSKTITPHAYSAIAQYAGHLMLVGGHDKDGNILQEELKSKDFGLTWQSVKGTKMEIPQLYVRRYGHSVIIPGNGFIYFIGGYTSDDTSVSDVWSGLNYSSLPGFKS